MQVVYSPVHLAHDITHETYMGVAVPANEVAERAERIRTALEADGGFTLTGPTEHGEAPITAVHDPGLLRFLEVAWSEVRRQGIPRPFLSADTYPNRAMFEGMSDGGGRRARPGAGARRWPGRVLGPGLGRAARRRDVCRVARGRGRRPDDRGSRAGRRDGRLRAVPAARPPRGAVHVRRLLLLQQRGDRGPRHHPGDRRAGLDHRCRLSPRQRQPADLLAPRRRPLHLHPRGPRTPVPVLPRARRRDRRGRRGGGEPEHPAASRRDQRGLPRRHGPGGRGDPGRAGLGGRRVARLRYLRAGSDRRLRPDDRRLPRGRAPGRRHRAPPGHPPGGRLPPAVARRERPGVAARRRGPAVRAAARELASPRAVRSSGDSADGSGSGRNSRATRERHAVHAVVEAAFADVTVADLVEALQADEAGRLGASLVAVDRDWTRSSATSSSRGRGWTRRHASSRSSSSARWPSRPHRQGEGIGGALVRAAIEAADGLAAPLLFLEGSPRYYPRFGFVPGGPLGFIRPSVRIPDAAFQVIRLPTWEPWMTGQLVYSEVFWRLDAVGLRD